VSEWNMMNVKLDGKRYMQQPLVFIVIDVRIVHGVRLIYRSENANLKHYNKKQK